MYALKFYLNFGRRSSPIYLLFVSISVSLNQFTKRRNELNRKERPAQSMLEVNEFVESMMAEGDEVLRHGLNSSLCICREAECRQACSVQSAYQ
jgi:hypothetical protein